MCKQMNDRFHLGLDNKNEKQEKTIKKRGKIMNF